MYQLQTSLMLPSVWFHCPLVGNKPIAMVSYESKFERCITNKHIFLHNRETSRCRERETKLVLFVSINRDQNKIIQKKEEMKRG